jgi:adenylate kinase family enzyme
VLFFKCPEKTAEQRFLARNLAGRESDNISVSRKRYEEFERLNSEIVKEYRTKGILLEVCRIDATGFMFLTSNQVDTSKETEVSYKGLLNTLKHAGVVEP